MVKRQLEEPYLGQLSLTDLIQLEREIDTTLIQTKSRKTQLIMESIMALHEKERELREENKHLVEEIAVKERNITSALEMMELDADLANVQVDCQSEHPTLPLL
ncbi:hypothetical protein NMG60_11024693 [Bertholletia excelsa]